MTKSNSTKPSLIDAFDGSYALRNACKKQAAAAETAVRV